MEYLNWNSDRFDGSVDVEVRAGVAMDPRLGGGSDFKTELMLTLDQVAFSSLNEVLSACLKESAFELRLDLPKQWTLYWKIRPDASRLLLSHPDSDVWVGTIALTASHGDAFLDALSRLEKSESQISLADFGSVDGPSNLDVVLRLK